MSASSTDLTQALQDEFFQARVQLARARDRKALKDTPANRAAIAECRAVIDVVLDMYLTVRYPRL